MGNGLLNDNNKTFKWSTFEWTWTMLSFLINNSNNNPALFALADVSSNLFDAVSTQILPTYNCLMTCCERLH